jgi:DNA-binding HxlR family transcriptional regulator
MGRSCASSDPDCPVARAISVLQEKWVLHIVHTLLDGPRGFNELGREVGGCNPTTLAQRLARLEELGLVTRSDRPDGSSRGGYALTAAGEALSDVIDAIQAWSLHHLHEGGPPAPVIRLRPSREDGAGLEPLSAG